MTDSTVTIRSDIREINRMWADRNRHVYHTLVSDGVSRPIAAVLVGAVGTSYLIAAYAVFLWGLIRPVREQPEASE